jgi:putative transposase
MRSKHPVLPLDQICWIYQVSRQAYYHMQRLSQETKVSDNIVLSMVEKIREDIPRIGAEKMHYKLRDDFTKHNIKLGRDKFTRLLRYHKLLLRPKRRGIKTTDSFHWLRKYHNLTEGLQVTGPEQLWVADITYIETGNRFSYLSLITDAYSRKIVGYCLHPTLSAKGCIKALQMALHQRKYKSEMLIHHSDRGIQYCSQAYVELLKSDGIAISMTQSGSPYDNAMAERINRTIKDDYCPKKPFSNHNEAAMKIDKIIDSYNNRRPHQSIDYLTPNQAHEKEGPINKRWKNYPRKRKTEDEHIDTHECKIKAEENLDCKKISEEIMKIEDNNYICKTNPEETLT